MIFNQKQWSLLETLRKRILMLNAGGHMEWLGHVFHGKCPHRMHQMNERLFK